MTPDSSVSAIGRDPDALEAFYCEHLEAVQRFVARRVASPHDAADLTADVFLVAIDASARYRGEAVVPRAWLYGIARRVVAGHLRSQARAARAVSRVQGRALLDDDSVQRIVERIDSEQAAREIFASIRSLPDSQRAVVELVAVDGLSLAEAASALGIAAGTARVRYHRARKRITPPTPAPANAPTSTEVTP